MECSLTACPTISQLGDFVRAESDDMDALESLEQTNGIDIAASKPSSSSASVSMECEQYLELVDKICTSNEQEVNPAFLELDETIETPNMLRAGALVTWRWDSMNATDLASVLDGTVSCASVSSITTEDEEENLCGDKLLMESEKIISGDFGIFPADTIRDNINDNTARTSNAGVLDDVSMAFSDCASPASTLEQEILADCKFETVRDLKALEEIIASPTHTEVQDQILPLTELKSTPSSVVESILLTVGVSQTSSCNSEGTVDEMKLMNSNSSSSDKEIRSDDVGDANHCLSIDSENTAEHDVQQQWNKAPLVINAGMSLEKENNDCPRTRRVKEGKIQTTSPRKKPVVSSQLSSRKRISRAQASRARRHASGQRYMEGKGAKSTVRKLMRLPSTSSDMACYQSSQNFATFIPILHASEHLASRSLITVPRAQPFQTNDIKQQIPHSPVQNPMLLPVVVSDPTFTPVQAQHSLVGYSSVEEDPNCTHEHQQIRSICESSIEVHDRRPMDIPNDTIQKSPVALSVAGNQGQPSSSKGSCVPHSLTEHLIQPLQKAPVTGFQSTVQRPARKSEFVSSTESLEAKSLKQLLDVITKLDGQTRHSVRDSFYRLARSAKLRQTEVENGSISNTREDETETNPLDRWVVNLLFCKQGTEPNHQTCSPKSSEVTCQALCNFPNTNANTHHWHGCVNAQEIMLCTY